LSPANIGWNAVVVLKNHLVVLFGENIPPRLFSPQGWLLDT